ncbi:MAG TPA: LPS assembly lipoprotein LptE [Vicinamibacterales bacterium]|nr:LPS assembly lipoprotein LptE [Vicinamibacterales bacterium]
MTRRSILQSIVVLALGASAGCGYSLSGRGSFLPPHIRVIGVPAFTNLTSVFDVERRVTERVVSELIGRGKYKVERSSQGVDAVLSGEISSIGIVPSAFNAQRQATRYALVLTAKIEFRDVKENKVLWSNPAMQFREEYENSGTVTDVNAFFGQDVNALDRLATEFARTLVSSILEAF